MSDIASAAAKLNDIEVAQDGPLTEDLITKIGANINYLLDTTDDHETRITAAEAAILALQTTGIGCDIHLSLSTGTITNDGGYHTIYTAPTGNIKAVFGRWSPPVCEHLIDGATDLIQVGNFSFRITTTVLQAKYAPGSSGTMTITGFACFHTL